MNARTLQAAEARLLVGTYDRAPVVLVRGRGAYVFDSAGRKYLDFVSGLGVSALGYSHPAMNRVIARQSRALIHTSNLYYHPYQSELARELVRISGMERVFFANSGTEAWEAALKFARAYAKSRGRDPAQAAWRVLAMEGSFHGRTYGSLATTAKAKYREPFTPLPPGVEFVRFNDVADLRRKFNGEVCAIGLEVVQGEGGIRVATREFLTAARELTAKTGALLLLDEIQSGLGRTGKYFAYQHYGIQPDVVTIAKPLAGGIPLGAALTTKAVAAAILPGTHGTTFGGGPLACAAAIEFLKVLRREKLLARVRSHGSYFRRGLERLQRQIAGIREVRGIGLMLAVELDAAERAQEAVNQMRERGILINRTSENVLRFLPPYIVTRKQIDQVRDELADVLAVEQH